MTSEFEAFMVGRHPASLTFRDFQRGTVGLNTRLVNRKALSVAVVLRLQLLELDMQG